MASPLIIEIPHDLDRDEVRRRMRARIGGFGKNIPGGATIVPSWPSEDRMALDIKAMGQSLGATLDIEDRAIRVAVALPMMLSMMSGPIAAMIKRAGEQLLVAPPDETADAHR